MSFRRIIMESASRKVSPVCIGMFVVIITIFNISVFLTEKAV